MSRIRIAVDAAGGDHGPSNIVAGALLAARHLNFDLVLIGSGKSIERECRRQGVSTGTNVQIVSTPDVIGMNEGASALRRKPKASVRLAAETVSHGDADAFFSAGNTGATLVAAHSEFGMLPGVDRPALATRIPTLLNDAVLLDIGATVACRASTLLQFGLMGATYAKAVIGVERPRVGLLSIGEEEVKGNDLTRDAHGLLKESGLRFTGNVEARDLYSGETDVVVCDGFTGNVALKVSEGLVEVVERLLHDELRRTFTTKLGYLLSRRSFRRFRRRVDYSEYGGAPLLGVDGLAVVGHGCSSVRAVRNALVLTQRFVRQELVTMIRKELPVSAKSGGESRQ